MRTVLLVTTLTIYLCAFGCSINNGQVSPDVANKKALQIVADPGSSDAEFNEALTRLEPVTGDASFWLKIASDDHFNAERRCRSVKHLFDHFAKPGISLTDIVRLVGTNVNWISYGGIIKCDTGDVAGWLPAACFQGKSSFWIPILPEKSSNYHLFVIFAFEDDLSLSGLLMDLRGEASVNAAANSMMAACQTFDSDDQEKRFPGSKAHGWGKWNGTNQLNAFNGD